MPVQIKARGFTLTQSLEQYVLRRITPALGKRLDSASTLRIGLSDINGPRGGADKCCQVHIALPQQRDVVVREVQPNMYVAIDSALRRARRALARRLSKRQARNRPRKQPVLITPEMTM